MRAAASQRRSRPALALAAGIGLRAEHCGESLEMQPDVGFIAVHAENYFGRGGLPLSLLRRSRRDHALSLHGVGLSIGSTDPRRQHAARRRRGARSKNQLLAERNRGWLAGREILALNLVSSPGSGKTTLLERTLRDLKGRHAISVIEGDQATLNDAERIRATGCKRSRSTPGPAAISRPRCWRATCSSSTRHAAASS